VGKVTGSSLATVDDTQLQQLSDSAHQMAAFWGAVNATHDQVRRAALLAQYSEQLVLQSNTYATLMQQNGLQGPFDS
jgi:hypothetical protein